MKRTAKKSEAKYGLRYWTGKGVWRTKYDVSSFKEAEEFVKNHGPEPVTQWKFYSVEPDGSWKLLEWRNVNREENPSREEV